MMRFVGWLMVATLAVLAGCAGKDTIEPPRELESFPATLEVSRAWSVSVSGVGRLRVALAPVVGDQRVYVAGRDGRVLAVGRERGERLWQRNVETSLSAGPAFGDGLVVVGASDGSVHALEAGTGELRWVAKLTGDVVAAPGVGRGVVVVRTGDGRLHGLDSADGGSLWTYEQSVPPLALRGSSAPLVRGETVITGFSNGRVVANQLRDGQLIWETPVGMPAGRTDVERMVDISSTPRLVGRDLYVVGFQGRLVAMGVDSGRILWSQPMSSTAGLGAETLGVWVTDADSEVVGFDRLSGTQMWRQDAMRARALTAPAPVGDALAVGDLEGFVHFLSQETGELVARVRAGRDRIDVPPVVSGDLVLVQTSGGAVIAYRTGG